MSCIFGQLFFPWTKLDAYFWWFYRAIEKQNTSNHAYEKSEYYYWSIIWALNCLIDRAHLLYWHLYINWSIGWIFFCQSHTRFLIALKYWHVADICLVFESIWCDRGNHKIPWDCNWSAPASWVLFWTLMTICCLSLMSFSAYYCWLIDFPSIIKALSIKWAISSQHLHLL